MQPTTRPGFPVDCKEIAPGIPAEHVGSTTVVTGTPVTRVPPLAFRAIRIIISEQGDATFDMVARPHGARNVLPIILQSVVTICCELGALVLLRNFLARELSYYMTVTSSIPPLVLILAAILQHPGFHLFTAGLCLCRLLTGITSNQNPNTRNEDHHDLTAAHAYERVYPF